MKRERERDVLLSTLLQCTQQKEEKKIHETERERRTFPPSRRLRFIEGGGERGEKGQRSHLVALYVEGEKEERERERISTEAERKEGRLSLSLLFKGPSLSLTQPPAEERKREREREGRSLFGPVWEKGAGCCWLLLLAGRDLKGRRRRREREEEDDKGRKRTKQSSPVW